VTEHNPPTTDELFKPLTDSVKAGNCVAVIGAGVSAGDYPLWSDLIQILRDRCGLKAEDFHSIDPLDIAETARSKDDEAYHATLTDVFKRKDAPQTALRYHLLARTKFISYVTLNFDPLLVDILSLHRNTYVSEYPWLSSEHNGNREVFHIHGRVWPDAGVRKHGVVLTRKDFDEAYNPYDSLLHAYLQTTFTQHDICFIGCNPTESNMHRLLRACKSIRDKMPSADDYRPPSWYLLWNDSSNLPPTLAECGIRPVLYQPLNNAYVGLDRVLAYWAGQSAPKIRRPSSTPSVYSAEKEPDHG